MSKYQLMTRDQEDLVEMVHAFMRKEVDPYVAEYDEKGICPIDTVRKLMDLGFWGIDVPEEYGGAGLDVTTIMYIREAMAYHDAGFANTFSAQTFGYKPVLLSGTEEQKKKWGERLANGSFWSMCITEPQSGSDAGNCKTKAIKDGDEYVLTGGKCFVTNGGISDIFTVTAATDPSKGSKGISLFIIERDMHGVSVGKHENKMGIRTSNTTEIALDEVRVPAENMIGGKQRLQDHHEDALPHPSHRCCSRSGRGTACAGSGSGIFQNPPVLRSAHRQAGRHPVQAGGHGDEAPVLPFSAGILRRSGGSRHL